MKWWQERVIYQIYPRSFQDSNGDGIGDIPGIISRLDLLKALGVGIIWLSPVYPSPNADYGYDISDYRGIHPDFGTMSDMENLIEKAQSLDIKIVMDLVINHTSDKHPWFQSARDEMSPYRDYYIWRKAKRSKKPNNWTSFFAEDCWTYDSKSDAHYLHLFAKEQPDLNYQNPKVIEEIEDIMRFWLDKGIAGFRCDVINIIYKNSLENGRKRIALTGIEHYLSTDGCHEILKKLRKDVLSKYDCFAVGETVFVSPQMGRDLCDASRGELDMIFSFEHMETDQYYVKWFKKKFRPEKFAETIDKWQNALEWPANYLENHDQPRSVSRFGHTGAYWSYAAKMLATMLLTLRGTPFIYQGQEIGMTNHPFKQLNDFRDVETHNVHRLGRRLKIPKKTLWRMLLKTSRDNARTPVQWNAERGAGFTTGVPWLAINPNHKSVNFENQVGTADSIWHFYQQLIQLRADNKVLIEGSFIRLSAKNASVFMYKRNLDSEEWTITLNFSEQAIDQPIEGKLILSNYDRSTYDGTLKPYEAIVTKRGHYA